MTHAVPDSAALPGALVREPWDGPADVGESARTDAQAVRVKSIVAEHYSFLWRSLRRLGVPEGDVEDAAQKCLWVVAQRIDDIARGKEKTFLFGVALRVAKAAWRERKDRRTVSDETLLAGLPAEDRDPGDALDDRRARALLDALLDALPIDLRTVFVLYELEELTMAEIAG